MIFLGAFVGALVFAVGLGLELADPRHVDWLLHGDWSTHFLGWHMFRGGPWTLPLGATPLLAAPAGSSVGLTDSIPIAAFVFKALDPLLPRPFQYFGLWLLAAFMLQGVFAVLLVRQVTSRVALQILGAGLLVLSPPLLLRVVHPALASHWMLLASLWLYFQSPVDVRSRRSRVGWSALVLLASGTHPYLAMMVLTLAAAAHGRQLLLTPGRAPAIAAQLIALIALAALVVWQAGYFVVASSGDLYASGLGFHSLNLLALVMPMHRSVLGYGPLPWATDGQYEGYAYLGAGLIVLGLVAAAGAARGIRRWRAAGWQHLPFALACVFLTLLAASPVITAGARTIAQYPAEWWGPLAVFRSSGRMFWPVYYALALGILRVVSRLDHRAAVTVMTVALALQAADTTGHLRAAREHRALGFNNPLDSAVWRAAAPHYRRLTLVPSSLCSPVTFIDARPFVLLAGDHGLAINAGAAARVDAAAVGDYCAELGRSLRAGEVSDEALYVLSRDAAALFEDAAQSALACTRENGFSICFAPHTYRPWQDDFDVTASGWPPPTDFARVLQDLDAEYRDRLRRGPVSAPAPADDRARAIARYLAYRARGCDRTEAESLPLQEWDDPGTLRLCEGMTPTTSALPPPNETLEFRRRMEQHARRRPAAPATSHVDAEGEAVWLQEYARLRLAGASHEQARDQVLQRVRVAR